MLEKDGTTLLSNLETGVYLIHGYQMEGQEMQPTLVFLPTWEETEGEMLYDVTLIPKLETPVSTGDSTPGWIGFGFVGSVFLLLLILFCKKRLRKCVNCDTIQ